MSVPNPRDPRYRIDQPLPIGTRVLIVGVESDRNPWLVLHCSRKIAVVGAIGEKTFLDHVPLRMRGPDGPDSLMDVQWPEYDLVPEAAWAPDELTPAAVEEWLES